MAQHVLIADLAAPLLLVGLRTPVLVFYLPRPVLVSLARRRRLRAAFRTLRRPLVAVPVDIATLYAWHLGFLFEGALRNDWLHLLQHKSAADADARDEQAAAPTESSGALAARPARAAVRPES